MDFSPLRRHRDYRLLYISQAVSFLGSMMTYVALPYQMFQLTHSSLHVGLLGVAELIPLLMTAFIGGALADSVDRRRMVIVTDVLLGLGSLCLSLMALHGSPPVWVLYVLAGFMSGMNGLQRPSIDEPLPSRRDHRSRWSPGGWWVAGGCALVAIVLLAMRFIQ